MANQINQPDPVPVSRGGTGVASTTAYAVVCGGTTSTAALQSIASVGTSGQVLTSNGAGALPTFQDSGASTGSLVAWVAYDGSGTVTILGSYNVASISDNDIGDYTINYTNALASVNYAIAFGMQGGANSGNPDTSSVTVWTGTTPGTSSVRVGCFASYGTPDTPIDPDYVSAIMII